MIINLCLLYVHSLLLFALDYSSVIYAFMIRVLSFLCLLLFAFFFLVVVVVFFFTRIRQFYISPHQKISLMHRLLSKKATNMKCPRFPFRDIFLQSILFYILHNYIKFAVIDLNDFIPSSQPPQSHCFLHVNISAHYCVTHWLLGYCKLPSCN